MRMEGKEEERWMDGWMDGRNKQTKVDGWKERKESE